MSHHVHFPASLPIVVGSFRPSRYADACVRAEDVHLAKALRGFLYQFLHVTFCGYISYDCKAMNFCGDALSSGHVNITDHNSPGFFRSKLPAQRRSNSVGSAGYDNYFVLNLHAKKDKGQSGAPQRVRHRKQTRTVFSPS